MFASTLAPGDRIVTEYGPATVRLAYPAHAADTWGAWKVLVQPDGYLSPRTLTVDEYHRFETVEA